MSKYSFELKLQVVQEYLSGVGGYTYLQNISYREHVNYYIG